jgi:hypothetical protein
MGVQRKLQAVVKNKRIVKCILTSGGRRRKIRIARYSSQEPDESVIVSADVIGGKIPIDCLVRAGVIRDDDRIWLQREAYWRPAPPRKGYVLLEVFELQS